MKPIFLLFFLFCCYCQLDFFSSTDSTVGNPTVDDFSSHEVKHNMVYCNKFDTQGFSGVLTAYYDLEEKKFNNNKVQLYLWKVPEEFNYPPTNFVQLHLFRIEENRENFDNPNGPVNMSLILKETGAPSHLIKALDHRLLTEKGGIPIDKFLNAHVFILEDTSGWQGVTLSVFNEHDQPIKVARLLLPPFIANPRDYLDQVNQERHLLNLHPFANLFQSKEESKVFYEKGLDFCKNLPVDFEVPAWTDKGPANLDQLLDEFSFYL